MSRNTQARSGILRTVHMGIMHATCMLIRNGMPDTM